MAIQYEPGEEIQLDVEAKRNFFVSAMSWSEQRHYETLIDAAKSEDGETVETDDVLKAILTRLTRTEPAIDLTFDGLSKAFDYRLIWTLNAAVKLNLTYEEKKSSESPV